MPEVLKSLFSSRKFWMTILGSAVTSGLAYAQAPDWLIVSVAGMFGTNIIGNAMEDKAAKSINVDMSSPIKKAAASATKTLKDFAEKKKSL